jgi:hypothetical protein
VKAIILPRQAWDQHRVKVEGKRVFSAGNYSVVFGIKDKPFDRSDDKIIALDTFNAAELDSQIVWDASVRMSRRVRHSGDDFYGIMDSLREQGPVHGQPLSQIPVFAGSFTADPTNGGPTGGGCGGVCTPGPAAKCAARPDPNFSPAVKEFKDMYCTTPHCLSYSSPYSNFAVPAPGNIYATPLRFKLGGHPILSARFNVETAGSEQ